MCFRYLMPRTRVDYAVHWILCQIGTSGASTERRGEIRRWRMMIYVEHEMDI